MTDKKYYSEAKTAFNTICNMLNDKGWSYVKDENALKIESGAKGNDMPIKVTFTFDTDIGIVKFVSVLPFEVREDKRIDMAVAVGSINDILVEGGFIYDIKNGKLFFRLTNSLRDCKISEYAYFMMLIVSCKTVDEYNDKLLELSDGTIDLNSFLKLIKVI